MVYRTLNVICTIKWSRDDFSYTCQQLLLSSALYNFRLIFRASPGYTLHVCGGRLTLCNMTYVAHGNLESLWIQAICLDQQPFMPAVSALVFNTVVHFEAFLCPSSSLTSGSCFRLLSVDVAKLILHWNRECGRSSTRVINFGNSTSFHLACFECLEIVVVRRFVYFVVIVCDDCLRLKGAFILKLYVCV